MTYIMRFTYLFALFAAGHVLVGRVSGANAPAMLQDEEFRIAEKRRAPVSTQSPEVRLPSIREGRLPNGATLLVLEDRRRSDISIRVLFPRGGAANDPPHLIGVSSLLAQMMLEGTSTYSPDDFAVELDRIGGWLGVDAVPGQREARLLATSLSEHSEKAMRLVGDVLAHPAFPEEQLALVRERTQQRVLQVLGNAAFSTEMLGRRVLFGVMDGRQSDSPAAVTRKDVLSAYRERFNPDGAIVGLAGDISFEQAKKGLEVYLRDWRNHEPVVVRAVTALPRTQGGGRVWVMDRPNSVQTTLAVVGPAVGPKRVKFPALAVLNRIVGGGPTSRLNAALRFNKGYTYGAYSTLGTSLDGPYWYASSAVRNAVAQEALQILVDEVQRVRTEGVSPEEIEHAKQWLIGRHVVSLDNSEAVLVAEMEARQQQLNRDHAGTYVSRIGAVTPEDVRAAAQEFLAPDKLHVVAVGPIATARAAAGTRFGQVYECSPAGQCPPSP